MQLTKIEKNGIACAVVNSNEIVITDAQSALDVLMSAKYDIGTKNIVVDKKLITEDFFILKVERRVVLCPFKLYETTSQR